ncbi:hypothetical protein H2248_008420 [Termitomyces sp. 'cryptogamus']|nr:hypothetical protein H2248_008420 [Termitomyces sp. 'cryptogamus']
MESKSILVNPAITFPVYPLFSFTSLMFHSLLPIVLIVSMSRGVTMSPRIQVYRAIACRALNAEEDSHRSSLQYFLTAAEDCSSAAVQARAARIQASVVTLMSVLSAIATGFWSRLGDVHGRKPVLALFLLGAICMELTYVLVMRQESLFGRHAEGFILAGPILEGLVGGLSSFNGVVHAYTSDCTRHGSRCVYLVAKAVLLIFCFRSGIFSTIQGIVFVGLAAGPWFSGLVLPKSATLEVENAFALSISLLLAVLIYILSICPESREPTLPEDDIYHSERPLFTWDPVAVIRSHIVQFIKALVIPITMFAPRSVPGRPGKSYNLTLVGMALFLYLVSIGVYSAKYLYAQHVYSWTTAELGYYMSILWITRAFNLLVFLPIIISYFKPKTNSASPDSAHIAAELHFDKRLAQASLAVDGLADALVALTPASSQTLFTGLSCLSSFTSGGNPTLHSLAAVCLHACGFSSEVGALFGGLAVLSAIAHIINPYIYALTYSSTVAYFPKAIFVLATALLSSAVLLLTGVSSRTEDVVIRERPPEDDEYSSGSGSAI